MQVHQHAVDHHENARSGLAWLRSGSARSIWLVWVPQEHYNQLVFHLLHTWHFNSNFTLTPSILLPTTTTITFSLSTIYNCCCCYYNHYCYYYSHEAHTIYSLAQPEHCSCKAHSPTSGVSAGATSPSYYDHCKYYNYYNNYNNNTYYY